MSPTIYIHWRYTLVRVNFSFLYIIHFCRNSIVFEMVHKMAASLKVITLLAAKHNTTLQRKPEYTKWRLRLKQEHDVKVRNEETFISQTW